MEDFVVARSMRDRGMLPGRVVIFVHFTSLRCSRSAALSRRVLSRYMK